MPDRPKRPSRNRQPKREAVDEVGRSAPAGRRETAPRPGKSLDAYAQKRDFATTPEPRASAKKPAGDRFCVQKHAARRLHFDLRLELDGVLKSWAVTRGPSLVPGEKRLAVHTEDHPLEYLTFEGVIPKGEYGGGTMIVWDQGRWTPLADPKKGYAKGHLDFELAGQRLKGHWHLVRMRPRPREKKEQWLLLKGDDGFARTPGDPEITEEENTSVISGRTNADLAALGEVRRDHAARADTKAKRGARAPASPRRPQRVAPSVPRAEPCELSDKAPQATRGSTRSSWTGTVCRRASTVIRSSF